MSRSADAAFAAPEVVAAGFARVGTSRRAAGFVLPDRLLGGTDATNDRGGPADALAHTICVPEVGQ
jgi:hypothetical protein